MNRETKRLIEFGNHNKPAARAAIRREAAEDKKVKRSTVQRFVIPARVWLKSQPNSTLKGIQRGKFILPSYVQV